MYPNLLWISSQKRRRWSLWKLKKNKDGGNTPDPFADVAINNVVNGHVAPTRSTSPAVDHSQVELTKVGFSLNIIFV